MERILAGMRRALRAARTLHDLHLRTVAQSLGVPYPTPVLSIAPDEFRQWLQQQEGLIIGRGRVSPWLKMFAPYLSRLGAERWAYPLDRDDTPLARFLNERLSDDFYISGPWPFVFLRGVYGVPYARLPAWAHAFDKKVQRRSETIVTKEEALRALDEVLAEHTKDGNPTPHAEQKPVSDEPAGR